MNSNLIQYYKERASEYENIYQKSERQRDILKSSEIIAEYFKNKQVLEIACGTGFWTEKISTTAKSIVATDVNESVLDIAKTKNFHTTFVEFKLLDIFNPPKIEKTESLFGGFIWSHIPLQYISKFIQNIHDLVEKGGSIVFMDNKFVEGSSTPIYKTDDLGNTFQLRKLKNNSTYEVLKNFPTRNFLFETLQPLSTSIEFTELDYFWLVKYNTL